MPISRGARLLLAAVLAIMVKPAIPECRYFVSETGPVFQCISPRDGAVLYERRFPSAGEIESSVARARAAQASWAATDPTVRQEACRKFVAAFVKDASTHAEDIAAQMGRPIRFGKGEVAGFEERAARMIDLAPDALANLPAPAKPGFTRFIQKRPLGLILIIAPWNYPYLTAVNSIVPALLAGNAVILKHSHQTALCAERLVAAAAEADLPDGLFQYLHMSREQTAAFIAGGHADGAVFTGSVQGGAQIETAAKGQFIPVGLELGGKDPAYVRADAEIASAAAQVADGAFFNSGQSCCGVERVYVHADIYDDFVDALVAEANQLKLGDPFDPATTLGPMVRSAAADFVRAQVSDACGAGARCLIDETKFSASAPGTPYLAPQVLVDVDHNMGLMRDETFGPAIGVMKVENDEEAIALMNDSDFGLTASIWSADVERALDLAGTINTGTVFLNRCDYLDPDLAWTGVKQSGRGVSLSPLGFDQLTRVRSIHFRHLQE